MALSINVADTLVEAARLAAEENSRSVAAQIEHWALLGRAVEQALTQGDAMALKRSEGQIDPATRARLAAALSNALDPLRSAVAKTAIGLRDAIRYETDPALPDLIIQRLSDGSRRIGKMVNRQFVVEPAAADKAETAR